MTEMDEQDQRIAAILGTKKLDVTRKTLATYLKHLKQHLQFPCLLTGMEDFRWEEFYVFGPGSPKEYKELKKTRPSYTDTFRLIDFSDAWDEEEGLLVNVERVSDKKRFTLPLADLEATDEEPPNYALLDDYSVWFVNYR